MKKFEGLYKNNQCFLVGNGPSLNDTPLDILEHYYSFGMNQINLMYDKTIWRPTFYIATTGRGWHWSEDWRTNINENLLMHNLVSFVGRNIPMRGLNIYPMNILYKGYTKEGVMARLFSEDCAKQVGHLGTTMYIAFQLAVWMGFNPIFFVGCDLGYEVIDGQSVSHFQEGYWGDRADRQPPSNKLFKRTNRNTLMAHRVMKAYADSRGIQVYNATVGGDLDVWPRKNLMEATK